MQFDPADTIPVPRKVALVFRYVFEGGKHYVVMSFAGQDDWQKVEIDRRQVSGFIEDALPRVLVK